MNISNAPPDRRLIYAVLAAVVLLGGNLLVYFAFVKKPAPVAEVVTAGATDSVVALAAEQRSRGIQAIRAADYPAAIAALEAAAKLDPSLADVPVLLDVAKKLQNRPEPSPTEIVAGPPPEPSEPKPSEPKPSEPKEIKPVAKVERPRADKPPRPEPVASPAILLVTSNPPRLIVKVDGQAKDMTPARLELKPGSYRITLADARKTLWEKEMRLGAGEVSTISETFAASEATALEADKGLDLVALIDRGEAASKTEPVAKVEPKVVAQAPRLVVYAPNTDAGALSRALGGGGVEWQVVGSSELKGSVAGAAGVVASPEVLRAHGLEPSLFGAGAMVRYQAVALQPVTREQLASATLGIVDDLGKKQITERANQLVGGTPKLRRVTKVEDLLPMLQFKLAVAVLVREAELAELRRRTRQELYSLELQGSQTTIAVAWGSGGNRELAERAVRGMSLSAKGLLGVEKWVSQ